MKKIFALFALLLCFVQFSQAGDKVTRDVNKLPVAAREMINKHFRLSRFLVGIRI